MFGKIKLVDEFGDEFEVSVIEQTKVNNINYLLVSESDDDEEDEVDAFIVKDLSAPEEEEAIYEIVEDDEEFDSIAKIFDELVGELD